MAGDWIQMRVALARDPKVIAIADYLATQRAFMDWLSDPVRRTCNSSAYEHVTRNVTVSVTVAALLQVWGVANESGHADGDDLVLRYATIKSIDDMAGVPEFGAAMASVDWVVQETNGSGKSLLRFPEFMERNIPATERNRSANAERQRRFRDRHRNVTEGVTRNVTQSVTVTHTEEKRRDSKKPPVSPLKLPPGITDADWQSFRDHRSANRKRLTPRAEQLAAAKLHHLAAQGYDPKKLLDTAIEHGWATFYARDECRVGAGSSGSSPGPRVLELGHCPCGAPATMRVGNKPRCAAHRAGYTAAAAA